MNSGACWSNRWRTPRNSPQGDSGTVYYCTYRVALQYSRAEAAKLGLQRYGGTQCTLQSKCTGYIMRQVVEYVQQFHAHASKCFAFACHLRPPSSNQMPGMHQLEQVSRSSKHAKTPRKHSLQPPSAYEPNMDEARGLRHARSRNTIRDVNLALTIRLRSARLVANAKSG